MRFARKLAYALWLGICIIYGINGTERYRREANLFETDIRRDHEIMGRGIAGAIGELWQDEGKTRAIDIVGRTNAREADITIRWVDLASRTDPAHAPTAPDELLAAVSAGNVVNWTDPAADGMLYTYVPLRVAGTWTGALELSESLKAQRAYLESSLRRMMATFASLALMSGLVAMGLGVVFVGRPIRLLVEKARRVGDGEFEGRLELRQNDELGELAREMDTMSAGLASAQARVAAETKARTLALDQLRHAERLTTVGKLASGVAHELGTPLNVITVRAAMIAEGEVEGVEARNGARIIREQTERITRVVRQLLDFARRGTPDKTKHDLVAVVERSVALLTPLAKKAGVELAIDRSELPLTANIDPVQIQQVLANLIMNGIQAMPSGGQLKIELYRANAEAPPDLQGVVVPCVAVDVIDGGAGMDAATLSQAFDPFFTTKNVGEGTGLGLSVAYGIVREHGGWISAASTPGQGTRFTVFFPEPTP